GGTVLRIRDLATVKDIFADEQPSLAYAKSTAFLVNVLSVPDDNVLHIAKSSKKVIRQLKQELPPQTKLLLYKDVTSELKSRISLLAKNGLQGLLLVLITLAFFMNIRLAFWVATGLLLSVLGSFIIAQFVGISINMMSLFGVILVVGILVDDAVVVAENVYAHVESGNDPQTAAILGTQQVLPAVMAAVTTTCLTFLPLFFMGGFIGKFIYMIPAMVVAALIVSLFESTLLLPAHLAHALKPQQSLEYRTSKLRLWSENALRWLREKLYAPLLHRFLHNRWIAFSDAIALLFLSVGLLGGGMISFVFFPKIEGDRIAVRFKLAPGSPKAKSILFADKVEIAVKGLQQTLKQKYKQDVILKSIRWIGLQTSQNPNFSAPTGDELGEVQLELLDGEMRKVSSQKDLDMWKERLRLYRGLAEMNFVFLGNAPVGKPLEFQLKSSDSKQLRQAANRLKTTLAKQHGVFSPEDDMNTGKRELRLSPTPLAQSLGISMQDIALQIRRRLYGQEVMSIQRGPDEVKVFVRYPNSKQKLESLWIQTPQGKQIPLMNLVKLNISHELKVIRRLDRKRVASVVAQLDETKGSRQDVIASLQATFLPQLKKDFPNVQLQQGGQAREQAQVIGGM
ncbi:MAG: efflux RND transporter permease subunit, partial [Myxococcota bacterium]